MKQNSQLLTDPMYQIKCKQMLSDTLQINVILLYCILALMECLTAHHIIWSDMAVVIPREGVLYCDYGHSRW